MLPDLMQSRPLGRIDTQTELQPAGGTSSPSIGSKRKQGRGGGKRPRRTCPRPSLVSESGSGTMSPVLPSLGSKAPRCTAMATKINVCKNGDAFFPAQPVLLRGDVHRMGLHTLCVRLRTLPVTPLRLFLPPCVYVYPPLQSRTATLPAAVPQQRVGLELARVPLHERCPLLHVACG